MRIWAVLVLGACTTNHTILVQSGIESSWAQGTVVVVGGYVLGEGSTRAAPIERLDLQPAGLATAERIDDHLFAIRPLAPGALHVSFAVDGEDNARDFEIVEATLGPLRVTTFDPQAGRTDAVPDILSPRPTSVGVFTPMRAVLQYAITDGHNGALAGAPIEPWAPLDRLTETGAIGGHSFHDQFELAIATEPVTVSVGGEQVSVSWVPQATTTRVALIDLKTGVIYDGTSPISAPVTDVWYSGTRLSVLAYDETDRLLLGGTPTITTATSTIETSMGATQFTLWGHAAGASSFTVTYDGVTTTFPTSS